MQTRGRPTCFVTYVPHRDRIFHPPARNFSPHVADSRNGNNICAVVSVDTDRDVTRVIYQAVRHVESHTTYIFLHRVSLCATGLLPARESTGRRHRLDPRRRGRSRRRAPFTGTCTFDRRTARLA